MTKLDLGTLWIDPTTYATMIGCSVRTAQRYIAALPAKHQRYMRWRGGYIRVGLLTALPKQAQGRGNPHFRDPAYQRDLARRIRTR